MVVNYGSDHISNWTCYVYNLASNSLDHVSNWKCVVLKSGHNFGQMSFFSGTLIRTDVAFGQMSLSDRSRVTHAGTCGHPESGTPQKFGHGP